MASRRTSSSASRRHAREADLARREGVSRCEASRLVPGVRSVVLAAQFESRRLPARVGPRGCSSPSVTSDVISEGCAWRGRGRGRRAPRRGEARGGARAPRGAVDLQQDQPAEGRVPRVPRRGRRPGRRRARAGARGDPSAHARVRLGQSRGVRARARRRARTRRARRTRRNHPNVVPGHVPIARQGARRRRRARRERRSTTGRARNPDIERERRSRVVIEETEPRARTTPRDAPRSSSPPRSARRRTNRGSTSPSSPRRSRSRRATRRVHRGRRARPRSRASQRRPSRRVPGRSRRREIGARDAHQRRLQTSRTALLRNDGRRLAFGSSRRLAFGSSRRLAFGSSRRLAFGSSRRLAFGSSRRLAFGSSRLRDDELVSGLLSLFASSSRLGGVRRAPVRLGAVQDRVWSRGIRRRGERGGVPRAFQNRRRGPSASTSRGTVRVRVVGDVSRLRARTPVRGVVARRGRGSVESVPLIVRVRVVASEPRGAKRVRGASRVGARGVRGAGDSRAIVV